MCVVCARITHPTRCLVLVYIMVIRTSCVCVCVGVSDVMLNIWAWRELGGGGNNNLYNLFVWLLCFRAPPTRPTTTAR